MKRLLYFVVTLFLGELVLAVTGNTVLDQQNSAKSVLLPENLSIATTLSLAGTVSAASESEGSRTATLALSPYYKLGKNYTLLASASVTQEYEVEKVTYSNLGLSLRLPSVELFYKELTLNPFVATTLPTNHVAYRDESYRGSVSLGSSFYARAFKKSLALDIVYSLSGGRNLHKFTRNNLRGENTEYFMSHGLSVSRTWSGLTLYLRGSLNPVWKYSGVYEPTYSLSQSVSYLTKKGLTYTLTHSNSDRALDYRGDFSNVKLLDDYSSRVNLNISYIIK